MGDFSADQVDFYDAATYQFQGDYSSNSSITNGMVTMTGAVADLGQLIVAGGSTTITGSQPQVVSLQVNGTLDLSAVTLAPGSTTLSMLTVGGTLLSSDDFTVTGLVQLSGGTLEHVGGGLGSVTADGGMSLAGNATLDGYSLINPQSQTATLTGNLYLFQGSIFDNEGSLILGNTGVMWRGGGDTSAVLLLNNGSISKPVGTGEAGLVLPIDSNGPITLSAGSLDLGDHYGSTPSIINGAVTGAVGTLFYLTGGSSVSTFVGDFSADQVDFYDAATYQFQGAYQSNLSTTNGTVTMTGPIGGFGTLNVNGGVLDLTAATLAPGATTLSSLTIGGTLRVAANFMVTGAFNDNGTLDAAGGTGSVTANGGMSLAGGATLDGYTLVNPLNQAAVLTGDLTLDQAALDNYGMMTLYAGTLQMSGGSTIDNFGAILGEAASNTALTISAADVGEAFQNDANGTVTQVTTGALRFLNVAFDNNSANMLAVYVEAGGLEIDGGGVSSGNFQVDSGAALQCNGTFGGTVTMAADTLLDFTGAFATSLEPSSQIVSAGTVEFEGGAVAAQGSYSVTASGSTEVSFGAEIDFTGNVAGVGSTLTISGWADFHGNTVSVSQLTLNAGLFISDTNLTVSQAVNWGEASGMDGPGVTTVLPGATLTIDSTPILYNYLVGGRQLVNQGIAYFNGLSNGYGDMLLSGGASVVNEGTFYLDAPFFAEGADTPDGFEQEYGTVRTFPDTGLAPSFTNLGMLIKTAVGDGGCTPDVVFNNSGTVAVQSEGVLNLLGGGTIDGTAGTTSLLGEVGTTINLGGSFTLTPTSSIRADGLSLGTVVYQIGGPNPGTGFDQITVSGSVGLDGQLSLELMNGFTPNVGDTFTILNNQGPNAVSGTFDGLPEGSDLLAGGYLFKISYVGGNGQDITLTDVGSVTPATLQQVLVPGSTEIIQATTPTQAQAFFTAANGLDPTMTPASTILLDLGGQTIQDTTANVPPQLTLTITNGTFIGGSPALIVDSGQVSISGSTFSNASNTPTILVNGGSLTLRNDLIQESTAFNQTAIAVAGGTVDLGTASDAGQNIFNVNGAGALIYNTSPNPITASGDTFEMNGIAISTPATLVVPTVSVVGGTFTYDGTPHLAAGSVSGIGGQSLGTPSFTYTDADGNVVAAPVNAGTYTVVGSFTDSANYTSASATATLVIATAPVTITWSNPANITYGTPLSGIQLNASATAIVNGSTVTVPGNFTYTPAAGTVLNAGNGQTLSEHFVPSGANYSTPTGQIVAINVKQATATTQRTTATTPYSASAQTLTLTGNVTSNSSVPVSGGTLTFTLAGFSPVSGTVTNGTASAILTLPAGKRPRLIRSSPLTAAAPISAPAPTRAALSR